MVEIICKEWHSHPFLGPFQSLTSHWKDIQMSIETSVTIASVWSGGFAIGHPLNASSYALRGSHAHAAEMSGWTCNRYVGQSYPSDLCSPKITRVTTQLQLSVGISRFCWCHRAYAEMGVCHWSGAAITPWLLQLSVPGRILGRSQPPPGLCPALQPIRHQARAVGMWANQHRFSTDSFC